MWSRLLNDLVWGSTPRTIWRALSYLVLVIVAAVAINGPAFVVDAPVTNDTHALMALEEAQAWAYCGRPSSIVAAVRIPYDVRDKPELRTVPLRLLVERKAGSIDAYCRSYSQAVTNNENSLMLLETALLRATPGLTTRELGQTLHLIRITGVAVFVLLLIDLGGSLALALAVMLSALSILGGLQDRVYSLYPFLFVLLLVEAAYYGFALKYGWTDRPAGLLACVLLAGVLAAFAVNMRSSYLPIIVAFFGCFVLADLLRGAARWSRARQALRAAVLICCFVAAYAVFQRGLITRFLPPETAQYASHIASHSLVIAIGVPESEFSLRLGITWLDSVGARLALQVDPEAKYLGPRYNAALTRYYESLWRAYPWEMVKLYIRKFSTAGMSMLTALRGSSATAPAIRLLLWPLSVLPNGIWLLVLFGTAGVSSLWLSLRSGSVPAFVFGLLSLAACLLQIESGMVYSLYALMYHNYLLFYVMFLSLLGVQGLLHAARRVVGAAAPR